MDTTPPADDDLFADWDLEGLVDSGRFAPDVPDKIAECGFFLDLMRRTTDWNHFRWLTSAFLEAARAAMDWMAYRAHHYYYQDEEGDVYDDRYVGPLRGYMITTKRKDGKVFVSPIHSLLKELCDHRRETAHRGPLWIKPEKVASPSEFIFKNGGKPVVSFCEEALDLLATIPYEVHEAAEEAADEE